MAVAPQQAVASLKESGLSFKKMKEGMARVGHELKDTGEYLKKNLVDPVKEVADEIKQGYDVYKDAAKTIKDIESNYSDGNLSGLAKGFDEDWDKLSDNFDSFYSTLTGEEKEGVLEAFAKDKFGETLFSAGSIIKQEAPKVLGGIDCLLSCFNGKLQLSDDPLVAMKQIKDGVDKAVAAAKTINTSIGTVFSRVTNEFGIDASALSDVQNKLVGLVGSAANMIPADLKIACAELSDCIDIYSSGKMLVTSMVTDFKGGLSSANLAKMAKTFNSGWDSFAQDVNGLYEKLSSGQQKNILDSFAKSAFGESVFNAGGAIKQNLPGIFSGIESFERSLDSFKGSFRNPVVAAQKIKNGVDGILNASQQIAGSLQKIAGQLFKDADGKDIRIPVLDEMSRLNQLKSVKALETTMRILGGGATVAANTGGVVDAVKSHDWKGAYNLAKKAVDDIKGLTKNGLKGVKDDSRQPITSSQPQTPTGEEDAPEEKTSKKQNEEIDNDSDGHDFGARGGDSYVVSMAKMRCNFGTSQSTLSVYPDRTVYMAGQPMGNISDHTPLYNIAPFGKCRTTTYPATGAATAAAHGKLTPMPCIPGTMTPWMNGKNDVLVKNFPALLKSSYCRCQWGGIITITDDGQHGEGTQWVQKQSKDKFCIDQPSSKDGSLTDKFDLAVQYKEQGMGIMQSILKANHDVNFKNAKNKEGWMNDDDADKRKSNKHYGKNDQYGINCATTTTTFMLRKRGYDVTARARNANEHTDSIAYGLNYYDAWRNPDGSAVIPTMLLDEFNAKVESNNLNSELVELKKAKAELHDLKDKLDSSQLSDFEVSLLEDRISEIERLYYNKRELFAPIYKEVLLDSCKEEGYYTFGLIWESVNIGGGHYTVLKSEKDKDGNIILSNIEPQTGKPFQDIDTLISYLDYPPDSDDTVMRTDDKVFNEEYNDLFDIN